MSNTGLGLLLVFMFLINLLLYNFKLETVITEDGIYVKLFPIHFKFRFIDWNIINKSYTRKYKPLLEFGGWGLRYGFGEWLIMFREMKVYSWSITEILTYS